MIKDLPKGLVEAAKQIVKDSTEYQKFFQSALKKFGVTSPKELSGDKEKEFYDYVDANWKGKNEKPEQNEEKKDKKLNASTCSSEEVEDEDEDEEEKPEGDVGQKSRQQKIHRAVHDE